MIVTNVYSTRAAMRSLLDELDAMSENERTPVRGLLLLQARADLLLIEQLRILHDMRKTRSVAAEIARCNLERQALAVKAEQEARKWGYMVALPMNFTERSYRAFDGNRWRWNDMVRRGVYEAPKETIEEIERKYRK